MTTTARKRRCSSSCRSEPARRDSLTRRGSGSKIALLRTRDVFCNRATTALPRHAASMGVAMAGKSDRFGARLVSLGGAALFIIFVALVLSFSAASVRAEPPAAPQYAADTASLDSFAGVGANPSVGDSQHASGTGTNTGNNPPGIGCPDMSDHCGNQGGNSGSASNTGNNPPGVGCPDMSDHCGNQGGNSGSASNTGNNPPGAGCPDMSDHCGNQGGNSGSASNGGNNPPGIGCPDMSDHCGNQGGNSGSASNTGNNPPGIGCPDMSDHCGQKDNGATATGFKAPAIAGTTPAVQPTVLGGKPPISFDKPVASGPPLTIAPQH